MIEEGSSTSTLSDVVDTGGSLPQTPELGVAGCGVGEGVTLSVTSHWTSTSRATRKVDGVKVKIGSSAASSYELDGSEAAVGNGPVGGSDREKLPSGSE